IRVAYDRKPLGVEFDLIKRSLRTPHAKIWVVERPGGNPFSHARQETLNPRRWVKNNATLGRRCPLPDRFDIELKGAFIAPDMDDFFVDESKLARACDLHCRGFS